MTPTPIPPLAYQPFDTAQTHILLVFVISLVVLAVLGGAIAGALRSSR